MVGVKENHLVVGSEIATFGLVQYQVLVIIIFNLGLVYRILHFSWLVGYSTLF
jgi:hypothetical protein